MLAPFCFGAVRPEVQAALAVPIALSLVCAGTRLRPIPASFAGRVALIGFVALSVLSLLPLPGAFVQLLSPEAARLGDRFGFEPRLSLAPGQTVERVWQIGALFAVGILAREAAVAHRFASVFSFSLAFSLIGLAATEFWLLADGRGVWNEVRNYPGGTFANRNHFACWLVLGSMFVFGALIRSLRHLRRGEARGTDGLAAGVLAFALLAALGAIVASGSRGGMLALVCGLGYWVMILFRQRARGAGVAVLGVVLVGVAVAFGFWGELFMQRLTQDAVSFKWRIWRDAVALAGSFPWTGIGLGAFEPVFGIFKTFHGEGTFLFAENDYVQWLVETGVVGLLIALAALAAITATLLRAAGGRFSKAELFHGAMAGLVAFAVHASVEFVSHVYSTALLAAALLGFAMGVKERATGPAVISVPGRKQLATSLLVGVFLVFIAVPQLQASLKWRGSAHEFSVALPEKARREALLAWPLEKERAIFLARRYQALAAQGVLDGERARVLTEEPLRVSLAWHPLDWELNLERAWLRLGSDPMAALPEVLKTLELNPLQARIPLRFAETYTRLHPPSALEILRAARWSREEDVSAALEIAWKIERSAAALWEIAPGNEIGLKALQRFGERYALENLAREAGQRLNAIGK